MSRPNSENTGDAFPPTPCSALNNWLEEQAVGWENKIKENPALSGVERGFLGRCVR